MRHLYDKVHLNRDRDHRRALFSNLTAALVLHKRIVTTLAKARYLRRFAERVITFARRGDLHARRIVASRVRDKMAVKVLFEELGPLYKTRNGGYTRIIHLPPRHSDSAPMAILELVGFEDLPAAKEEEKKEKKKGGEEPKKKKLLSKKKTAPTGGEKEKKGKRESESG